MHVWLHMAMIKHRSRLARAELISAGITRHDRHFAGTNPKQASACTDPGMPIDMDMEVLLGKPPRMTRDVSHLAVQQAAINLQGIDLQDARIHGFDLVQQAGRFFAA